MFDKMKQLMELKRQADQMKRELDSVTVEVNEARGIKLVITGSQNFNSVEVDAGLLNPDQKKRFEADLLRSLNAAIRKSQHVAAQKMKDVMPGMSGFPGM